jgi:polyketide synthase PksN
MKTQENNFRPGLDIAVIGMAGQFPGAKDIHQFWENLTTGIESIVFFSDRELKEAGFNPKELNHPNLVKANSILEDIEYFDAAFFGYLPWEAEAMDPQVRFFHQYVWHALEDAGYNPETYPGAIGLYGGATNDSFWELKTMLAGTDNAAGRMTTSQLGNKDHMNSYIAYKLNLTGPVFTMQTQCSTSLAAVHLACQGLLSGECYMTLAGGVSIKMPQKSGYMCQEGMILSSSGHCKSFDARADGTIFGNGAAVVVLKRIEDAVSDKDHIYAVIKGTAINNDGNRKAGYIALSVEGQADVIRTAHQVSQVEPESITYIETHSTGTSLGDNIEIEALKLAFNTDKKGFCRIGSVKGNIGQLDNAAGVTSLIKTVLALNHRLIPPTIHFEVPNPQIDFKNSPFVVNSRLTPWESNEGPRRAGVSSFGIGGTNAHVILEEAPEFRGQKTEDRRQIPGDRGQSQGRGGVSPPEKSRDYQLILLSARTPSALDKMTENLAKYFKKNLLNRDNHENPANPGPNLADAAYTLQTGRKAFNCRRAVVCSHIQEAVNTLESLEPGNIRILTPGETKPTVVFMFSGQGVPYKNMGLELYQAEPVFQKEMDHCITILESLIGPVKPILYPALFAGVQSKSLPTGEKIKPDKIDHAFYSGPLEFIFDYSMAKLLMNWGIKPHVMIGHGFGEYVAACLSGVFSLEDALRLTVSRGKALGQTDPLPPAFKERVAAVKLHQPQIPYISCVTEKLLTAEEATDPGYWAKPMREKARFADGISELIKKSNVIFIQVGVGRELTAYVNQNPGKKTSHLVTDVLRSPKEDVSDIRYLLDKIGDLWLWGQNIDWKEFYQGQNRYRMSLPLYWFEGQRFWKYGDDFFKDNMNTIFNLPQFEKEKDISDWFYIPSWKPSDWPDRQRNHGEIPGQSCWLVFMDECGLGTKLVKRLEQKNRQVISVRVGTRFAEIENNVFTLNPRQDDDFKTLFDKLQIIKKNPDKIIHLWGVTNTEDYEKELDPSRVNLLQDLGLHSLINIARAMGKQDMKKGITIGVVTNNMRQLYGEGVLSPGKATVIGPVRTIPAEFPGMRCFSVDIVVPAPGSEQENRLVQRLISEFAAPPTQPVQCIAFRGNNRMVETLEPVRFNRLKPGEPLTRLKEEGVYLVVGGLGGVGMVFAEYLARTVRARLILVGRSPLPPPKDWEKYSQKNKNEKNDISLKIRKIQELESLGARVLVFSADVSNPGQMQQVIAQSEAQLGRINGVIHSAMEADRAVVTGRTRQKTRSVISAKVMGTLVLDQIFKDRKLDFFALFSSTAAYASTSGEVAYCAACAFQDAYARHRDNQDNRGGAFFVSINWDAWQEVGQGKTAEPLANLQDGILPREGIEVFEQVIQREFPQVVVSPGDFQLPYPQQNKLVETREELTEQEPPGPGNKETLYKRPELKTEYAAPVTAHEKKLAEIWQSFFGINQVGILDDFFELGGDSLKAMMVISKIQKELKVRMPLTVYFECATIKRIAEYIEKHDHKENECSPIRQVEKKEYYAQSSAQKRLFFLDQLENIGISYNMPRVFKIKGRVERGHYENAFNALIARHESLRTSFHLVDNEPVQKVHDKVNFEIEYLDPKIDQVEEEEQKTEDRRQKTEEKKQTTDDRPDTHLSSVIRHLSSGFIRPFDLSKAPLLRAGIAALEQEQYLLLFDMHHIIGDGTSGEILTDGFIKLYLGEELLLLRVQYKDFSTWQNNLFQTGEIKKQEDYWLNLFSGEIPKLNLPYDYPRPDTMNFAGDHYGSFYSPEKTSRFNRLCTENGVTLYMNLLAAYYVLLYKYSGQEDIIVGSGIAGRPHANLQNIIGMFVNTLAMRNYPRGDKTYLEFLTEVKENTIKALENQDMQFEELVYRLNLERDPSRNPLFDVEFNVQNFESANTRGKNIEEDRKNENENKNDSIVPHEFENKTSKFDLILYATEMNGGIHFLIEYSTALFKPEAIKKIINHYIDILDQVIEDKLIQLKDINISHELVSIKSEAIGRSFGF